MKRALRATWIAALVLTSAGLFGGLESVDAGNDSETRGVAGSIYSKKANLGPREGSEPVQTTSSAQGYGINKLVVSSGGGGALPQSNTGMLLTINQTAAGTSAGQSYGMELGFWSVMSACPISVTGDVQQSNDVDLTDVVYLVNYVLKAGPEPFPCPASGDANCSGAVNSTDIIYVVNYVLKAGPPPCDACSLVPWTWSCP